MRQVQSLKRVKLQGTPFQLPDISIISPKELPNYESDNRAYYLSKTKFGHWPVYKKVQNTKITTEIKRISGNIIQFKQDLIKLAKLPPKNVTMNQTAQYVNVKGDVVDKIKQLFDKHIKPT